MKTLKPLYAPIFGTVLVLCIYMIMRHHSWINDEVLHPYQVVSYMNGEWLPTIVYSTYPGFHWALALVMKITGLPVSVTGLRLGSTLLSIPGIWAAWALTQKLSPETSHYRTIGYALFPFVFLYFTQIHTEGLSLSLLLLALLCGVKRQYVLSIIWITAAILTRQQNIIWAAFLPIFCAFVEGVKPLSKEGILWLIKRFWGLLIPAFGFAGFVYFNGGVAVLDKGYHPIGMYFGNTFYFLSLIGILLMPMSIRAIIHRAEHIKKKWYWYLGFSVLFFVLYSILFTPDHQFLLRNVHLRGNGDWATLLRRGGSFKLYLMDNIRSSHWYSFGFGLSSLWGAFALSQLSYPAKWYLFLSIVLVFLPQELIASRYAVIPFVLSYLLVRPASKKTEMTQLLWLVLLSSVSLWLMYFLPISIRLG